MPLQLLPGVMTGGTLDVYPTPSAGRNRAADFQRDGYP